ncbi:DUF6246 family protein [Gibbsiella quercinecans]|uniref:DUF6246 family protein n=1 Tax=Gibbsiella quercinecans TaxID=929813 RepID=UPI001600CC28|nr:DUF6246 family protein [Gibbsiella quercinecans]
MAKIHGMDHDAILLHEVGAATLEQGVGLMVNADLATPLKANSGALIGESYRDREQRLDRAAKERFAPGENEYAWVADFTDSQVVIIRNGGAAQVYGYTSEGGKIIFDETGTPVARQESWVTVVANKVKSLFNPQGQPANNQQTEGDMPLTTEEKQELITEIGKGLAANFAEALKPITEKVEALQANHIIGKAKIRKLQRHESNSYVNEFNAFEYISAARNHFNMPRAEAERLSMTEFQLLLAAKYPEQKGFTREEYDQVMDEDEKRWQAIMKTQKKR